MDSQTAGWHPGPVSRLAIGLVVAIAIAATLASVFGVLVSAGIAGVITALVMGFLGGRTKRAKQEAPA